jgi:hypothetical protein
MGANRISSYSLGSEAPAGGIIPPGFAVCQLPQFSQSPIALQLIAQQQAYERALLSAREEALRLVLSRLETSLN